MITLFQFPPPMKNSSIKKFLGPILEKYGFLQFMVASKNKTHRTNKQKIKYIKIINKFRDTPL